MARWTLSRRILIELLALFAMFFLVVDTPAARAGELSEGQLIYVPAYSSIYFGDRERQMHLAVTLSVRNSDPEKSVKVERIEYRDEAGKIVRQYAREPFILAPLESRSFVIKESDTSGGVGSSFLVEWRAVAPSFPLLAEAVMIGVQNQQGLSFTSRGVVVRDSGDLGKPR